MTLDHGKYDKLSIVGLTKLLLNQIALLLKQTSQLLYQKSLF